MNMRPSICCLVTLLALTSATSYSAPGAPLRHEAFCRLDDYPAPMRTTHIFVAGDQLKPAQDPESFRARNSATRDAVQSVADPFLALDAGTSVPRERVTVYLLPDVASTARPIFTGCMPGYEEQELRELLANEGTLSRFFSGGIEQEVEEARQEFRTRLISSLVLAARDAEPTSNGEKPGRRLVENLAAVGGFYRSDRSVPRVFLVTDAVNGLFGEEVTDEDDPAVVGRAVGADLSGDLGQAELFIVSSSGGSRVSSFAEALFIPMNALVQSIGPSTAGNTTSAPTLVRRYVGQAQYPGSEELIQARIALDQDGNLVNSWLILRGTPDRSIPMTGQAVCQDDECRLTADDRGFAQLWTRRSKGDPIFEAEAPFGGFRDWTMTMSEEEIRGKVYDPAVELPGGQESIPFEAARARNASF